MADDGRPAFREALDALRNPAAAPDLSLDDAWAKVSLPGVDGPAFRDAFKAANPQVFQAGTTCAACASLGVQALHVPYSDECRMVQAVAAKQSGIHPSIRPPSRSAPDLALPPPEMPEDPSPGDMMAGIGIADMLRAMTAGGVEQGAAERIIGSMLAAHAIMTKEAG
jgi:hypothetical protein